MADPLPPAPPPRAVAAWTTRLRDGRAVDVRVVEFAEGHHRVYVACDLPDGRCAIRSTDDIADHSLEQIRARVARADLEATFGGENET